MNLTLLPNSPLTTDLNQANSLRGQGDYYVDLTDELETSETIVDLNSGVYSSDTDVVEVVSFNANTAVIGDIAIGKAMQMRLLAKAAVKDRLFTLTVDFVGDSGTSKTGSVTLQLVDKL